MESPHKLPSTKPCLVLLDFLVGFAEGSPGFAQSISTFLLMFGPFFSRSFVDDFSFF